MFPSFQEGFFIKRKTIMNEISLTTLLEAGCHFGHRVDRWHPKAAAFIFGEREGIHIIDLAKTRDGLTAAALFVNSMAKQGKTLLVVGTKRQARIAINEASKKAAASYLTSRWVGGFLTNWEEVKKNIDKLNRMKKESTDGTWNEKFLKHERVKMEKEMHKLEMGYGGVAGLAAVPDVIFIVDIKKEHNAVSEAKRRGIPIVAIVDTNSNPTLVDFAIPANDDAVGSVKLLVEHILSAFGEGKILAQKEAQSAEASKEVKKVKVIKEEMKKVETKKEEKVEKKVEVKEVKKEEVKAEPKKKAAKSKKAK